MFDKTKKKHSYVHRQRSEIYRLKVKIRTVSIAAELQGG